MMKQIFKSGFFLKCLMVLLAIGWSTSAVKAEYWQVHVVAIHSDGTPAASYVSMNASYVDATGTEYTMPSPSSSVTTGTPQKAKVKARIVENNCETFQGWYEEEACTTYYNSWTDFYAPNEMVPLHGTAAEATSNIKTIYALFKENPCWKNLGVTPEMGHDYYILSANYEKFVGPSTTDITSLKVNPDDNDAYLFTLTTGEVDPAKTIISIYLGETKYYLKKAGAGLETTYREHTLESGSGGYHVKLANGGDYTYWEVRNGTLPQGMTNSMYADQARQLWLFIPEQTYLNYTSVNGKNADGSVTISDSPTGQGTAYVSFNVSELGSVSCFDYALSDNANWELGTATRSGNVITVPVTYTAQNVHGNFSTTVTMTSRATTPTSASATATAIVNLQPAYTIEVSALDWSTKQEGEEIYNVGMEVAASQREHLQNKLVYSTANAIAQNDATWTATITNDAAGNFKFANGTQSVSGTYSPDLLDVIYAPKSAGTHTATLQVEVSYTDVKSPTPQTLTCETKYIALSGKATDNSMLTLAVNGSETASANESHNFGEIIGTNSEEVTIDLYIHDLANLTAIWDAPEGVFEFDESTIDFTKANQRLVILAHPSTPVKETTNYSGILTIKSGETTVGTLTLQYTAKPLLTPEVTWNWANLNEDATYTDPLTIVSDGAWTLTQRDGNGGMTYDAEAKSITTEYMHHESGYQAKFELEIEQTNTYAAYTDTLTATINAYVPPVIEINSLDNFNEYVTGISSSKFNDEDNSLNLVSDNVYFKWSGQSYFAFDFDMTGSYTSAYVQLFEVDQDGTEHQILYQLHTKGNSYAYPISSNIKQLKLKASNYFKNIRYWEYETIKVNKQSVQFVGSVDDPINVTAEFANKRAVTISLNAAAQEFFELRATGKPTGSSLVYNNADGMGVHKVVKDKVFKVAFKDGVTYADAQAAATNGFQVILKDNYTYNSETVILPIVLDDEYIVIYKGDANGSYKVAYHNDMEHPETVSATDVEHTVTTIAEANCTATLSEPTPASGYMFRGWKVNGNLVSCKATYTVIPASGATVEPIFIATEEAVYGIDDARFADLDEALSTAGSIADTKPVVVLLKDVTLSEAATHTIPAGVTLLIPYKADFNALQVTPEITTTAQVLAAYRTLTLKEGVNIVVNGNICVSGKIMAAGGGSKSAYTTGECGVINMATGGHIELNDGAHLYCWGYIKGQDMDQGNNTQGTGTVTVNSGAIVHENFELGDWRGGTASSDIYYEKDDKHLFPFQSYALQNVEVPTTYTYGSKLETFMAVNTGFGSIPFAVSMIGSTNTLFLLQDEGSVIRKWYDPTTDLTCYELSGTAQLDQLVMNLPFVGNFESGDCNLPISNSMHIILKDDLTLSKRLMQQAGSIIEIKSTATINLENELYMYDKDQWGKHIHDFYFRSFNNLTSHKDRGDEKSKDGLDDAKFIVDGVLNVRNGGKLYATAGGANVMGNGGGEIHFMEALPSPTVLWAVDTIKGAPYIKWVSKDVKAANLCNEDGSYTKSSQTTYYNINGRWFYEEHKDALANHTYDFYYLDNGNTGEEEWTAAVYSHDKTGLEARMKWFNVTMDEDCLNYNPDPENIDDTSDWWKGTNPTAYYNYTMLNDWHQFMPAEGEGVYSGSNNALYQKDGCGWTETGVVDENCLYTFDEAGTPVKKALVNGAFIPLTANGYDPAYHATANASQYYICFAGCNWHPATPYEGESKAYTIHPEDEDLHYIWFNNDWMNVLRDEPFFYTEDEQTNVRTYYEYINGEWEIATPYVSVSDAAETRNFYMIKEAFNVASIKKDATITLLRDIPNVTEVLTYTTQNTTCTLDLNGHVLSGDIANMITVNAPGATFIITDNTTLKLGKISNAASKAVYVQKGTLVVENGTIETTVASANAIEGAAAATININGGYFVATSKCVYAAGTCAITGGYYNINTGLANYTVDAYPFANDDPVYKWVVEAAWTIIFKNGETTLQTLHLHPGEMPVYTAAFPTLDNHQFTGWDPAVAAATANVTYQAQFAELVEGEKCVTFNANGGNATLPYKYVTSGSAVGELPTATKAGHTFDGWFTGATDGDQIDAETTISANVTYYAHYTKNSYTLTWDANGATITSADDAYTHGSVEYGTTIIAPAVSKDGWTFEGWNVTPASTMPAANTTYTAQWTIPYTVQHKQQNLNDAGYTVFETDNFTAKSGEYVTPAVKTYDGFITPATQTVRIGETTEVTYNYARRTYTITLDATTNEGECATASVNVKHGGTAVLPAATKTGRVFEGWFTKAVGGDEITNETVIQYNIGTLYAQFSEANMNITAPTIIDDTREVTDLRITTTGKLTVSGSITATNFILESNGETASGQLIGATNVTATNAYFDLKINAKNHMWYAVAVPWQVDAESGISVNGRTLQFGKDFDILFYDGATRASAGANKSAWKYMEDEFSAGYRIMQPGVLYMIGLMSDASTIRFAKKAGATLLTTAASVEAHNAAITTDANWNGIANPALFHAYLNAGTNVGQKYDADAKSYEAVALNTTKLVVGQPVFVQAPANKDITVTYGGAFAAAPRRKVQAEVQPASYEVSFAADNKAYTTRIFIHADEEKTEDTYVIGKDLAKIGVSSIVPQMWISRYDAKLCMNTVAPVNGVASYPLSLYAPTAGEYTISNVQSAISNEDYDLYVTYNGEAIWNLSDGAYTLTLEKGTANEYGLRISVRKTPTGIDEAVVNANGETRKVLINGKVFIIRGNNVYSVHGQLVK